MSHIKVNTQESIYSPDEYGGQIKYGGQITVLLINHLVEVTITPDEGVME